MQDATGYSILITGGGSGLGAGIAQYMADKGARVTISGRRVEKLEEVAAQIGPACAICVGDVANAGDRARMVKTAVACRVSPMWRAICCVARSRSWTLMRSLI